MSEQTTGPTWLLDLLASEPPPLSGELRSEVHAWLKRGPKSPLVARRLLRKLLAQRADGERFRDGGQLLVSELVTNAVVHARVPAGRRLWVRFAVDAAVLRIEVHDASGERPVPRQVGELAESGRGLLLVQALSQRWGCCPRAGGVGKVTWCEYVPES
ncbi:serine/threonine-protein kinase RsbW [Kitasatospora sp. MAA4]|uniref:ATP-binding protein n=1 Tax=Kitasatospora sp. MAA4 TaxID=3035093 RepID=UPI0024761946|nr:ATP-binding protein [Kitasatospora sp. MAA4]MDH6132509.1 serine/threonine-protein kinase RsbW [Kitasatospora sp. MAA4]